MKHLIILTAIAGLTLGACGGGSDDIDTPEDVKIEDRPALTAEGRAANEYLGALDELATTLASVTDEASAEAAAADIRETARKLEAINAKYENELGERKMGMVLMSRSAEVGAVQQRLAKEMMRLAVTKPELFETLSEEMDELEIAN